MRCAPKNDGDGGHDGDNRQWSRGNEHGEKSVWGVYEFNYVFMCNRGLSVFDEPIGVLCEFVVELMCYVASLL